MHEALDFNTYRKFKLPYTKDESDLSRRVGYKIGIAKTQLIFDFPFFGYIITQFDIFPTRDIDGMLTDFKTLYYNPESVFDYTVEEIQQSLIHLILHLILKHPERRKGKNKEIFSIAAEISVDLMMEDIIKTQNKTNWKQRDTSRLINFLGLPTEKIYSIIYEEVESMEDESSDSNVPSDEITEDILQQIMDKYDASRGCSFDEAADMMEEHMTSETSNLMSESFNGLMRSSFDQIKDIGNLPESLRSYLQNLLEPELPWTQLLQNYIQKTIMVDWKWNPPNRRFIGRGMHLPSPDKEHMTIVIAVDTSGSISQNELDTFISEIYGIINSITRMKLILITCDAKVHDVFIFEDGESMDGVPMPWDGMTFTGGGGTRFEPVFKYVNNHFNPDLLCYFTDGYGSYPDPDIVSYPTLWIMTSKSHPKVTVGSVIYFNSTNQNNR